MDEPVGSRLRAAAPRIAATLAAYAVGVVQFLAIMTLLVDVIHVTKGMVAWSALVGLVLLGLGALSFVIAVPAWYAAGQKRGTFAARVLLLCGLQGFLFAALHVLRYVVNSFLVPGPLDWAIGGVGLAAGIACTALAAASFSRARRARRDRISRGPSEAASAATGR